MPTFDNSPPSRRADLTGRVLLAVDSAATLVAFAGGIMIMLDSPDDDLITDAWRAFAYIVFAGLWALLAANPRGQRGIWELILIHKVAITVFALAVLDVPTAPMTAAIDGFVVVTTVAAWFLCRGWQTWTRSPGSRSTGPRTTATERLSSQA